MKNTKDEKFLLRRNAFVKLVEEYHLTREEIESFTDDLFPRIKLPFYVIYEGGILSNEFLHRKAVQAFEINNVRIPVRQSFPSLPYNQALKAAKSVSFGGKYCHLPSREEFAAIEPMLDELLRVWRKVFGYEPVFHSLWLKGEKGYAPQQPMWKEEPAGFRMADVWENHKVLAVMSR